MERTHAQTMEQFGLIAGGYGLDMARFDRLVRKDGPINALVAEYRDMPSLVVSVLPDDADAFAEICRLIRGFLDSGLSYEDWLVAAADQEDEMTDTDDPFAFVDKEPEVVLTNDDDQRLIVSYEPDGALFVHVIDPPGLGEDDEEATLTFSIEPGDAGAADSLRRLKGFFGNLDLLPYENREKDTE